MKKERAELNVADVLLNTGQLDWLPENPRTWTQTDIDDCAASIMEDEDFLEDRPLLVVPFRKKYVCFAGNLRHEGCLAAKKATVPCVVHHPETEADYETVLRRAMKDNGQYGKTDWHKIYSSKWGTLQGLEKWGLTPHDWNEGAGQDTAGQDTPGAEPGIAAPAPPVQEDEFDENADAITVRCRKGDVWELGEHRLMCGDSIDLEQVKTLMGGGKG